MDKRLLDNCPLPLQNNKLNVENHLRAIKEANLGPSDPTQPNHEYWSEMGREWGISEGDARGRLCMNCEHYWNTTQIQDCIANGPAWNLKASALPLEPKWADIEDHPVGYCVKWEITCSPVRTCEDQEMGGPIDDERLKSKEHTVPEEHDNAEYADPFSSTVKSSLED